MSVGSRGFTLLSLFIYAYSFESEESVLKALWKFHTPITSDIAVGRLSIRTRSFRASAWLGRHFPFVLSRRSSISTDVSSKRRACVCS